MEGNVKVKVTSRSMFRGGEEELHFTGFGSLERTDYGWELFYRAVEDTDHRNGVRSEVRVEEESGRALIKNGEAGYGLLLDPTQQTGIRMRTDVGELLLQVQTGQVQWKLDDPSEGNIQLEYMLLTDGQPVSGLSVTILLTSSNEE